jgi:uncharacterized protein YecA (UPF0149 family)
MTKTILPLLVSKYPLMMKLIPKHVTSAGNTQTLAVILTKNLKKEELIDFCSDFGFKHSRSWNKTILASCISYHILAHPEFLVDRLPLSAIRELQRMVRAGSKVYQPDTGDHFFLSKRGLICEARQGDSPIPVHYLPNDFFEALKPHVDAMVRDPKLLQWNEREVLLCGIMRGYGVLGLRELMSKFAHYSGEKCTEYDFLGWRYCRDRIAFAIEPFDKKRDQYFFASHLVWSPMELSDEIRKRRDLDYYPFTLEEIRRFGDSGDIFDFPELMSLMHFWVRKGMPSHVSVNLTMMTFLMTMNEVPLGELMQFLLREMEVSDIDDINKMGQMVVEAQNNMPRWSLKGHTPRVLFEEERKHMMPLNDEPSPYFQDPVRSQKTAGRNDPCPCGSGKKFKHCCGA